MVKNLTERKLLSLAKAIDEEFFKRNIYKEEMSSIIKHNKIKKKKFGMNELFKQFLNNKWVGSIVFEALKIFNMSLNKMPLYLNDNRLYRAIAKWRLSIGK